MRLAFFATALAVSGHCMATTHEVSQAAVESARAALSHSLQASHSSLRIELRPETDATTEAELAAAPGWRVRSVDTALRRRMSVLMQPSTGTGRQARITFVVDAKAPAWKLLHAGDPSSALRADDVAPVTEDAVTTPDVASLADVTQWRLVRFLPEGHVLRTGDVAHARSVLRGDAVGVRYELGAVSLEAKGIALNAGKPGEVVKVSLPGRRDIVEGVLGDARQIVVKP